MPCLLMLYMQLQGKELKALVVFFTIVDLRFSAGWGRKAQTNRQAGSAASVQYLLYVVLFVPVEGGRIGRKEVTGR